ncbi:MAG TPA: hypothetical protein VKY74_02060, partial [Chloroflexia bacterium]|nr:hypothetical protein [Chloroflexia bacterium]
TFGLPIVAILVMAFVVLRPGRKLRTMVCTRCDGSGQVDEHWPDPSKPGGWHDVHGVCPKCKGVGRV